MAVVMTMQGVIKACLIGLIRNGMLYYDRCHIDGSCYDHAGCHQGLFDRVDQKLACSIAIGVT